MESKVFRRIGAVEAMSKTVQEGMIVRNGNVCMQVVPKGMSKKRYTPVSDEEKERGRVRRAIEDRRIDLELFEADLW